MTDDPKNGVTAPPSPTLTEIDASFAEYWRANYPNGVVLSNSEWHLPKLQRAVRYALSPLLAERDRLAAALRKKEAECERLQQRVRELEEDKALLDRLDKERYDLLCATWTEVVLNRGPNNGR